MKTKNYLVTGLALLLAGGMAFAQEDEEESKGFTYATYLYCDTNEEGEMDKQVAEFEAPIMDKLVEDGVMSNWGTSRGLHLGSRVQFGHRGSWTCQYVRLLFVQDQRRNSCRRNF